MPNPPLLLIDKPSGPSSFAVIKRLRQRYLSETGEMAPKLGHAGTLDPLASGLLLIGVGSGTKTLSQCVGLNKEYCADILLGEERDTGDLEGVIIREVSPGEITAESIAAVLATMGGIIRLPVPLYSAVKQGGVPLYKKARRSSKSGETLTVPIRDMEIYQARLLTQPRKVGERLVFSVQFLVGSGTYIRSLAVEVGRRLNLPATLAGLRRLKVGHFSVEAAGDPETIILPKIG